jgi:hypothetical protein
VTTIQEFHKKLTQQGGRALGIMQLKQGTGTKRTDSMYGRRAIQLKNKQATVVPPIVKYE